jgi:F-type H+-transporting ATPase subunit delta
VTVSIIGRRYASALLALAEEQNASEIIRRDLAELLGGWRESRELRSVFENPSVSQTSRRTILRDLAQASGMHPLLRDTLLLLSDRGRMSHLPEVAESFEVLAEEKSGRVRAEVVSATELPQEYYDNLRQTLERVTGKQVVVAPRVDPSLIGGVVTRVGDHVFDGSVKHRLGELKDELSRS